MSRTLVIGEALIDIVVDPAGNSEEHVGGSPLNVAAGIAALGHDTDFATTFGDDPRGQRIEDVIDAGGVHLAPGSRTDEPTSTAQAQLDESGAATYVFDLHWNPPAIQLAPDTGHVHTGSIAATLEPGQAAVTAALAAARSTATISYDPNARPTIMGVADGVRPQIEAIIGSADVVKASDDDIAYLYPGQSIEQAMSHWTELGACLVVVTQGAHGVAYRVAGSDEVRTAPTRATSVIDTVGAGDSFMAGLISGLLDLDLLGSREAGERLRSATLDDLTPAIDRGLDTSGITVGRAGAYAPTRNDLNYT